MSRVRRALACAVIAILLGSALSAAPAAAGPETPRWQAYRGVLLRGGYVDLTAVALEPGATYDVSATAGTLTSSGAPVSSVQATDGSVEVRLSVGYATPLSVNHSTVTAVAPDGSTISTTVPITLPTLHGPDNNCPARQNSFLPRGFADGDYVVHSDDLDPTSTTVTAVHGTFPLAASWRRTWGTDATVTVTATDATTFTYTFTRSAARASVSSYIYGQEWARTYEMSCLQPGETVVGSSADGHVRAIADATADERGYAYSTVVYLPTRSPRVADVATLTGTSSGQTSTTTPSMVWGTTLDAGHRLLAWKDRGLLSPSGRYGLEMLNCDVRWGNYHVGSAGFKEILWAARKREERRDDCYLALQTDGNLVLRSHAGAALWASNTAGTGSRNRLVAGNDGNLVLYTAANKAVWTSRTGIVRTPSTMGAGQVLTRGQSLVRGSTRLTLRRSGELAVVRSGKTLWRSLGAKHRGTREPVRGAVRAELTRTGRILLRNGKGRVIWANGGRETSLPAHLLVTATGDVVVTGAPGEVLWHTGTGRRR